MILRHDSFVMILRHDSLLWFCLLEGYCAHFISYSLFIEVFLPPFIDILRHGQTPMVRSQNAGTLTDTDLLPRQILFLTWLEALSIYCLIEKFCQLIDLFEFTESLIFWFVYKINWNFFYEKYWCLPTSQQRQSALDTAAAHLALHQCPTY